MSLLQGKLLLPKTYRPALLLRISFLVGGLVMGCILGSLLFAIFVFWFNSQTISGTLIVISVLTIILVAIIIPLCLYIINIFVIRLKLIDEGILFIALGQRFFTPWSNIKGFRDWPNVQAIELYQPTENISVREGVRLNVATLEMVWWCAWWHGRGATNFLTLPTIFGESAWDTKEMILYLQKYTHHDC